jgi:hypothetical protein
VSVASKKDWYCLIIFVQSAVSFFSLVDTVSNVKFSDTIEHVSSVYYKVINDSVACTCIQVHCIILSSVMDHAHIYVMTNAFMLCSFIKKMTYASWKFVITGDETLVENMTFYEKT